MDKNMENVIAEIKAKGGYRPPAETGINVEPTAAAVADMAQRLRDEASALDRIAVKMRNENNISYISEVMHLAGSLLTVCRLDLVVGRAMRTFTEGK